MAEWSIEPLSRLHDRERFHCAEPTLDDFIRARASQYEKRRLGKTFVAVVRGDPRVIGFHTIAAGAVAFQELPRHISQTLPMHPVPVVLLARLAVDRSWQGKRMGEGLLIDALGRSLDLSRQLGIHAVLVEAIDERAAAFYEKYGFQPLLEAHRRLVLPVATIEKILG